MKPSADRNATFRRVFDDHYESVARYCLRRLSPEDANDATAQVFVVAWRKIDQMPEMALPWLYRIAHYEVSNVRRTHRRQRSLRVRPSGLAEASEPSPDGVIVRRAEYELVLDALQRLRPADREVVLLRSYEDLSVKEIAAVLGCSHEAAKKRLTRALQRLRRAAGIAANSVALEYPRAIEEGGDV